MGTQQHDVSARLLVKTCAEHGVLLSDNVITKEVEDITIEVSSSGGTAYHAIDNGHIDYTCLYYYQYSICAYET